MDSENEAKKDKVRVIESDWLWEKILKNMNGKLALTLIYTGAELKATPIEERYIFKANKDEFLEKIGMTNEEKEKVKAQKNDATKNRDEYYKKMIEMLNKADAGLELAFNNNIDEVFKNELQTLGRSLRVLWKKYESYMRIHDYSSTEDLASYSVSRQGQEPEQCQEEEEGWTQEWGVFMNFEKMKKEEIDRTNNWLNNCHVIFHELFHNIYHAAALGKMSAAKDFGDIIVKEVNEILEEEKGGSASAKRLSALTFSKGMENDKPYKKNKAVLYDIIGAVLYKGKYGCHPGNHKIYNKNCESKFMCRCSRKCEDCIYSGKCNPNPDVREEIQGCVHRGDRNQCAREACVFKNNFDYVIKCHLCVNDWCDEIFGHTYDSWLWKELKCKGCITDSCKDPFKEGKCLVCKEVNKFPNCVAPKEFHRLLSEEAFVQMAAEAIVNPTAYKYIVKYLRKSEEAFRKFLKQIIDGMQLSFKH